VERDTWFKLVGFFTIVGAVAAMLVVPEVRKFLGLEPQSIPSPITTTEASKPVTAAKPVTNADPPPPREETKIIIIDSKRESWTGSDIQIQKGDTLRIEASGTIDHGGPKCGPDGNPSITPNGDAAIQNARWGALIGKIGSGDPFIIGSSYQGIAPNSGSLNFLINDTPGYYSDNYGHFQLRMTLIRK
jgi:hypothetical protein